MARSIVRTGVVAAKGMVSARARSIPVTGGTASGRQDHVGFSGAPGRQGGGGEEGERRESRS